VYKHIVIYVICYMILLVISSANILHIWVPFNVGMVHQFPPTFYLLWHMGLIHPSTHMQHVCASIHPSIHPHILPTHLPTMWCDPSNMTQQFHQHCHTRTLHFISPSQTSFSSTCSRYTTTFYINLAWQYIKTNPLTIITSV
jgi:hypothetical protein